jgi:hypothetical protein
MIEGIAQELFFHDNELNFYDADSWRWFEEWAIANNNSFLVGTSVANFFLERNFGTSGMVCDKRGCRNMVSLHRSLKLEILLMASFLHAKFNHYQFLYIVSTNSSDYSQRRRTSSGRTQTIDTRPGTL